MPAMTYLECRAQRQSASLLHRFILFRPAGGGALLPRPPTPPFSLPLPPHHNLQVIVFDVLLILFWRKSFYSLHFAHFFVQQTSEHCIEKRISRGRRWKGTLCMRDNGPEQIVLKISKISVLRLSCETRNCL